MTDLKPLDQDRLTRATNALYDIEWGAATRQGMMPVDYESTMMVLRMKAEAVLRAADGTATG